jgi:hypothetical protein
MAGEFAIYAMLGKAVRFIKRTTGLIRTAFSPASVGETRVRRVYTDHSNV